MTNRGDSRVNRQPMVTILCFLLTINRGAASTCSFPDYLQSRDGARRWMSHVTFGAGNIRCAWREVSFVGDSWETRVTSSSHCPEAVTAADDADSMTSTTSYRRRCMTSFGRHRYIVRNDAITVTDVAAPPSANASRYDVTRKQFGGYACVEFVRRSATVVQIRESVPTWTTARFVQTACGGGGMTLTLDDWLLVDYGPAFFRTSEPCPFADGGFSIRMFDKLLRRGVCDAFIDETRVESRCSVDEDDRIHFRFRYRQCVPEDLGVAVDQAAYCLASWSDDDTAGVFAYTLLRHDRDERTWCLRYPAAAVGRRSSGRLLRSFTAFLFRDAYCDRSRTELATARYLMMDFLPSLYPPGGGDGNRTSAAEAPGPVDGHLLCRDDYEACEFWRHPCRHAGSAQMLACSRRCGICNDDRPAACQLPQFIRGQWNSKLRPSHQQSDSAAPANDVTVMQHFVHVSRQHRPPSRYSNFENIFTSQPPF